MTNQISNLTNLFLKFLEVITEWDYLDSEVWQNACGWHGRENEKSLFIEYYLCKQQYFMKQKLIHFAWVNYQLR